MTTVTVTLHLAYSVCLLWGLESKGSGQGAKTELCWNAFALWTIWKVVRNENVSDHVTPNPIAAVLKIS
jgi:hypothetical protein